jgi:hypothetical protein
LGTFFQVEQLCQNLCYRDFNAIIPVFSTSADGWLTLVNIRQMILTKNALYADFVRRSSCLEEEKWEIAVRREFLELISMNVVMIL